MTRIGLLAHGGFDDPGQGVRIPFLTGLVERLSRSYDITVFSLRDSSSQSDGSSCGDASVRFLTATRSSAFPAKLFSFWQEVTRAHHESPFALLHGIWAIPSGFVAVGLGRRLGLPTVVSLHGAETASLPSIRYGHMSRQPHRALTEWTCAHAGAISLLSHHQRDELRRLGIRGKHVVIVPPGADPAFVTSQARPLPSGPVHFLHVANLTEVKDQVTLLRAFARIVGERESRLRIIGGDELHGEIQREAARLGIADAVEFLGFVPHELLPSHYGWAHVLLHTSLHEAGGVAIAEAASSHVVICGTATGIVHDLRCDAALAVGPGDAEGLAREVLTLLRDPRRFASLQHNAHEWARNNTVETAARVIAETYELLVAG